MVIHLYIFQISDLYLFFYDPDGVGNDCSKHYFRDLSPFLLLHKSKTIEAICDTFLSHTLEIWISGPVGQLVKTAVTIQGRPANWERPPEKLEKIRHFTRHRESAVNISRIWFPNKYLKSAWLTGSNSTNNIEALQKLTILEPFHGIRNILDIGP